MCYGHLAEHVTLVWKLPFAAHDARTGCVPDVFSRCERGGESVHAGEGRWPEKAVVRTSVLPLTQMFKSPNLQWPVGARRLLPTPVVVVDAVKQGSQTRVSREQLLTESR